MLVPKDIPKSSLQFLENNQQHFTTGFDAYSSLKSIAVGGKAHSPYLKSYSLFYEETPSNRDWNPTSVGLKFGQCWWNLDYSVTEKKARERGLFYVEF